MNVYGSHVKMSSAHVTLCSFTQLQKDLFSHVKTAITNVQIFNSHMTK